ncbi:hypothetical protein J7T55_013095 [Diaporthe amygdali]|uniref:uncharacterized protein n=1 Tax=Phomopsis amygdali TaxID=1214568 RepID=UPI0022FE8010|nr:uncharacterized protein J7T55_013095 [Diaporthe amygdali]KAJ0118839.1 hypothetical protein J7T55_013095 [Diaporthe amygdali]
MGSSKAPITTVQHQRPHRSLVDRGDDFEWFWRSQVEAYTAFSTPGDREPLLAGERRSPQQSWEEVVRRSARDKAMGLERVCSPSQDVGRRDRRGSSLVLWRCYDAPHRAPVTGTAWRSPNADYNLWASAHHAVIDERVLPRRKSGLLMSPPRKLSLTATRGMLVGYQALKGASLSCPLGISLDMPTLLAAAQNPRGGLGRDEAASRHDLRRDTTASPHYRISSTKICLVVEPISPTMARPKLILDPAQPYVQNHQMLASFGATNPKIIDACAHYELPCEGKNIALARARLAIHFMGATQPEGEPDWLKDLSGLFQRQRWKTQASLDQWAEAYFGERWKPVSKISETIVEVASMILDENNVTFDYKGPPVRYRAPKLPDEPQFNIIDCFSELLQPDAVKKKLGSATMDLKWINAHYTNRALAEFGIRAGDALYEGEEFRLRKAFQTDWVINGKHWNIVRQLDYDHIKLSNKKSGRAARLLPWNIAIAGPDVSLPIDLLVAFTVNPYRGPPLEAKAATVGTTRHHLRRRKKRDKKQKGRGRFHNKTRAMMSHFQLQNADGATIAVTMILLLRPICLTATARLFLDNPNPSRSMLVVSGMPARKSALDIQRQLTGPRDRPFRAFVQSRATRYSAKYPLGLRWQNNGGPPFDPNEYAGRPHPAVAANLFIKQTEEERERLRGPLSGSN